MSILELAEQFAAVMERLVGVVALERRADWLVLGTRLMLRMAFSAILSSTSRRPSEMNLESAYQRVIV
jgi:hypothetical protein